MATVWGPLTMSYLDLPPPIVEETIEFPLAMSYLDLPPPIVEETEVVPEAIEWTFDGNVNVTWFYGYVVYDTVLGKWITWHTWYDPDPDGIQYPEGSPVNWKAESYVFYVISIEGL